MKVIATIDTRRLDKRLFLMRRNAQTLSSPLDEIKGILLASVEENFQRGGRPNRWKKLSPMRIRQRTENKTWPGKILIESAELSSSINGEVKKNEVLIGSQLPYAKKQNDGSPKDKLPARPFLVIQKEDTDEAKEILLDHLLKGVNR